MSRLDELKKQYPELNISLFDIMVKMDTTKSYKYLALMCKILGRRFDMKSNCHKDDLLTYTFDIQSRLIDKGISTENLTNNQMIFISTLLSDYYNNDTLHTLVNFMDYMDRGLIEKNDVSEYNNIDDMRAAVTLASMKEFTKELETQIIKEYEDEKWLAVRPLTFSASAKYGASTRWCTTYQKEKNYFERYWRRGILVYFINKETGYKFAGYKGLAGESEFSFWTAEDNRIDYLEIDVDDYLFSIVRKIFKSENTNKNLCSEEIQEQVHKECIDYYEKMRIEPVAVQTEIEAPDVPVEPIAELSHNYQREINRLRELLNDVDRDVTEEMSEVPTMRA